MVGSTISPIAAANAEETRHFYEDILGLPLVGVITQDRVPSTQEYAPHAHIFFQMTDGSCIAFFDLGDGQAAEPSPNTASWVNHLALRIDSLGELETAMAKLRAAGVDVLGITDHGPIKSIYFFDPNGIRLELTAPVSSEPLFRGFGPSAHEQLAAWEQRKRRGHDASAGR
jgi:catechol 2,3-dioxygenase-like lactoylglutathione lyase family enzyme